jgi:two-component system OmpR family sensor kinase
VTVTGDARRLARARRLMALQAVGGVLAGVAVASLATFGVVLVGQHREQQTQLRSLADAAPMRGLPAGTWVVLLGADGTRHASATAPEGRPSAAEVAAARQHARPVVTESYVDDREYQTLTRSRGSSVVQVGVDVAPYENERHRLLWALLLAGLGAAVIAFGLGRWLGHRAVAAWDEALVRQRRFVADASHELRTPLSRLALRADLLQRELARVDPPIPAGAAGDLTLLRHEARGLGDIVQDLLHAADLEASPNSGELTDLVAVVREVVQRNEILATERRLTLRCTAVDVPPVRGAAASLRRVVDALVDNALRHASSTVAVRVEPDGEGVRVAVDDDGPGLSLDDADRVFDRFARGEGSTRGFGIGLALVREVVERHGGRVGVEPVDAGTRFVVHLPAARS